MRASTSSNSRIHYRGAVKTAMVLARRGFEVYIVGGAVRDILMGHLPKDFDLVTNAQPRQIAKIPEFKPSKFHDSAQAFGISRVTVELSFEGKLYQSEVELATYRRDVEAHLGRKATKIEFSHLEDDVLRRDFTINALALDPLNDYLVDYVDGLKDLDAGLIRFIGNPTQRIREDPLRILRAIRLKNQFNFSYELTTAAALKKSISADWLTKIAPDRVRGEITRMLIHPNRGRAVADLDILGALQQFLPEVVAGKNIQQPPQFHSEGDVFMHTLLALEELEPPVSAQLVWATLLHDIGKPLTQKKPKQATQRIRFDNHYEVGAQLAATVLKRFNFSNKDSSNITWMIHNHLAIDDLPKMRPGHRYNMMSHPAFADLMKLHYADANATLNQKPGGAIEAAPKTFPQIEKLWEEFQLTSHTRPITLKSELGIDGHWLKKEFNLTDGAQLGKVLEKLNQAYLDGAIPTRSAAITMVKKLLKK